ncbi:MAG: RNA-binding transcriptional accessory protein [Spirochaetales bacterium]|nr:RNA-binding transcriptional accessory protein [Spirochaetales bacterium]
MVIENKYVEIIAAEENIRAAQVIATAGLFEEGATVPFIARYRKEVTGNLDEVQILAIRDSLARLKELDDRKEAILKSLIERELLTPELEKAVKDAPTMSKLEDIYLPYRPKRKTRGVKAKEKGLEPLALDLLKQQIDDVLAEAEKYVNSELEVATAEEALAGARDIIAEMVNEDSEIREKMRKFFFDNAIIVSSVVKTKEKEADAAKYRDYFNMSEAARDIPSHRFLAIRRGADEGFLTYHILPEEFVAIKILTRKYVTGDNGSAKQVEMACEDSYRRLLSLSMETELRTELKKKSDEKAINVFAENLRELLLTSPMGQKATLGLDPGLRTGCKLVVLDAQGSLLYNTAIYPLVPFQKVTESNMIITDLVKKYNIEAVAVGNGTGGREALEYAKSVPALKDKIVAMVNESGASIYSASEVARKEFPDYDLTVRGAVSIGRRLMDPLAELVKIDPKSIGVGQYQHDVDQKKLKDSLDDTVISCVNSVGVNVNTASYKLLAYVAGLSERIATKIVEYRDSKGPFKNRESVKTVPGLGPKAFEQCAGFLRVINGENPLDASAVHPESYGIVEQMAKDAGCKVSDLMKDSELRRKIDLKKYVTETVGLPTLTDIMDELAKPGRDPRKEFDLFSFTEGVNDIKDLKEGMVLNGVVTNVTAFGAFVDIGVHQDGLVHISQLSDTFVSDPNEFIKVNQKVSVTVMEVDADRKRISLTMKSDYDPNIKPVSSSQPRRVVAKKVEKKVTVDNSNSETYNPFAAFFNNNK